MKTKADFEPDINEQIGGTLFCPDLQSFHQSLDNKVAKSKKARNRRVRFSLSSQASGLYYVEAIPYHIALGHHLEIVAPNTLLP